MRSETIFFRYDPSAAVLGMIGADEIVRRPEVDSLPFGLYAGGETIVRLSIGSAALSLQTLAAARAGSKPEFRGRLGIGSSGPGAVLGLEGQKDETAYMLGVFFALGR